MSVVDLRVASDKSNPSGIDLGCIGFADAFSYPHSSQARRGSLGSLDRLRLVHLIGTTIIARPHLGFSAAQREIHQHQAAAILALRTDSHSEKDSWTSKKFYMSQESSAGPGVSSRGSRLSIRPGSPS